MNSILMLFLYIPIVLPALFCVVCSLFNPFFFNTFPFLLTFLSALLSLGMMPVLYLAHWLLPHNWRFRLSSSRAGIPFQWKTLFRTTIVVIFTYLTLFGIGKLLDRPLDSSQAPKLAVIGLDGATWDLIPLETFKPFSPPYSWNLLKLASKGASGILTSIEPMDSPSVWTSIETGQPEEKHGVEGFFSTRYDLKTPRIWDVCRAHNLQVGLCFWLMTWPVIDDFRYVIPAWMAHTPETRPSNYACVQELNLEQGKEGSQFTPWFTLMRSIKRGVRLNHLEQTVWIYLVKAWGVSESDFFWRKQYADAGWQTDIFLHLLRTQQTDTAAFTLYGTDKLAHRYWHNMNPEEFGLDKDNRNEILKRYYLIADQAVGRILAILPESTHIVVLSDHGMKADPAMPRQFFVDIPRLLQVIGAEDSIHHFSIQREVILTPTHPEDREKLPLIQKQLETILFAESKEAVFSVELNQEGNLSLRTNFSLSWNEESPLLQEPFLLFEDQKQRPTQEFFFDRTFSGMHDLNGILILKGPDIKPSVRIENAGLLDIAPTLLHLLHLPISRELPGRVLQEALTQIPEPDYVEAYPPLDSIENPLTGADSGYLERLKSVGYVE